MMSDVRKPDPVEVAESLGLVRAALHASREASTGHVAILADPERSGATRKLWDAIHEATHALVRAEEEAHSILLAASARGEPPMSGYEWTEWLAKACENETTLVVTVDPCDVVSLGSSHSEPVSEPQEPQEPSRTPARLRARVRAFNRALGTNLPEGDLDWDMDDLSQAFRTVWNGMSEDWGTECMRRRVKRRWRNTLIVPGCRDSAPVLVSMERSWPRRDPFRGLTVDAEIAGIPEFVLDTEARLP